MGLAQKAFGNLFEDLFLLNCKRIPDLAVTRFPDGCRTVGQNKLIRVKTPCDWIVSYQGSTALIDTKTTDTGSFPHSKICPHQSNEMYKHHLAGASAGYVIWFRNSDDVFYISAWNLNTLKNTRGSIKHTDLFCDIHLGKSSSFDPRIIFGINQQ